MHLDSSAGKQIYAKSCPGVACYRSRGRPCRMNKTKALLVTGITPSTLYIGRQPATYHTWISRVGTSINMCFNHQMTSTRQARKHTRKRLLCTSLGNQGISTYLCTTILSSVACFEDLDWKSNVPKNQHHTSLCGLTCSSFTASIPQD